MQSLSQGPLRTLLLVLGFICAVSAFAPPSSARHNLGVALNAKKPTFNKQTQKWEPASDDDGVYPYDAVGSLLRFGPSPFLKRLTDAEAYEQSVLEYMAGTGASRAEATGNMDAKSFNAMDWAYQKMEEKKGKPKVDYTKLNVKQATLTVIWGGVFTPLVFKYLIDLFSKYI